MDIALMILLIVLTAAGVWAVVELALVIRKARTKLDTLTDQLQGTLDDVNGILANANTTLEDVRPTVQALPGLLEKGEGAVDALAKDLDAVDVILGDVSKISGTAVGATSAVARGASQATAAVSGAVSKLGRTVAGVLSPKRDSAPAEDARALALEEGAQELADKVGVELPASDNPKDEGFFTYPDAEADSSPEH